MPKDIPGKRGVAGARRDQVAAAIGKDISRGAGTSGHSAAPSARQRCPLDPHHKHEVFSYTRAPTSLSGPTDYYHNAKVLVDCWVNRYHRDRRPDEKTLEAYCEVFGVPVPVPPGGGASTIRQLNTALPTIR